MISLKLFPTLDASAFNKATRFFTAPKRAEILDRFYIFLANAVARTLDTGDVVHVNKAAQAAVVCGFVAQFRACVPAVVPFKFDRTAVQFTGTIQRGKRETLMEFAGDGVPTWEHMLRDAIDGKAKPKREAAEFLLADVKKSAKRLARKCADNGLNRQEVKKQIAEAFVAVYGPDVKPSAKDDGKARSTTQAQLENIAEKNKRDDIEAARRRGTQERTGSVVKAVA